MLRKAPGRMTATLLVTTVGWALGASGELAAQRTTDRFELRSDSMAALHHFLLSWASADAGAWPDRAVPVREREYWRVELTAAEAQRWSEAVEAYGPAVGRSLLFDRGLIAVRDRIAGEADADVPEEDRRLLEAMEAALPVYLEHWWPEHNRRNRAWIEAVSTTLSAVEDDVIARLEAAYGAEWPGSRIPVDIVPYTHPLGAYSTAGRVAISSTDPDYWMPQAVEVVFHEASHLDPLEQALRGGIRSAYESLGESPPERLWHDLIFFTTGEAVRLVFEARGQPGYTHYNADDYTGDPRWRAIVPALRERWQPFLGSGSNDPRGRRAALEELARALVSGSTEAGSRSVADRGVPAPTRPVR